MENLTFLRKYVSLDEYETDSHHRLVVIQYVNDSLKFLDVEQVCNYVEKVCEYDESALVGKCSLNMPIKFTIYWVD